MTIPKIIHQTWKIEKIPSEWQEYHKTCKDLSLFDCYV